MALQPIAADAEVSNDPAIKAAFFIVEPSAPQLQLVPGLQHEGGLKSFVKAVMPLADAPRA